MIGTIVNALAIIAGSLVGIIIGNRFSPKIRQIILQALGLITLVLGMQMALKSQNFMIVILSLVIGAFIGELIDLDHWINYWSEKVAKKFSSKKNKEPNSNLAQGFLTTTLLYCVGAMAIIGTIQEGLENDSSVLFTKSLLDGISSIFFASTFGLGVLFAAIPVFIYQALLTLLAQYLAPYFTDSAIAELTGTGGVILIAISFGILEIKTIRTANLLLAIPLSMIFALLWK